MKRNKYNNRKTVVDGINFDSKKEATYYMELKQLEKAKEIEFLELQPRFLLQEGFKYRGKAIRPIYYNADFSYIDKEGVLCVVDVKGVKTKEYLLKKKLFLHRYNDLFFYEV